MKKTFSKRSISTLRTLSSARKLYLSYLSKPINSIYCFTAYVTAEPKISSAEMESIKGKMAVHPETQLNQNRYNSRVVRTTVKLDWWKANIS